MPTILTTLVSWFRGGTGKSQSSFGPTEALGALGFLVSQSKLVDRAVADLQEQEAAVDVASTFQVPVARIVELTGLDFGQLAKSEAPSVAGFGNEATLGDESEITLRSKDEIRIPWA